MSLSPLVECTFGTNASQTRWNRSGICPSYTRRLVLKELSLTNFLADSSKNSDVEKHVSFEPFFVSKFPPRLMWHRNEVLNKLNANDTKLIPISKLSASSNISKILEKEANGENKNLTVATRARTRTLKKAKNKFRAYVKSGNKLTGLLDILQKRVVHDFHVESAPNYQVHVNFKTPMASVIAQNIKNFKVEINDGKSNEPLYTYNLDLATFYKESVLCETKPIKPDIVMHGGYITIYNGKELALEKYKSYDNTKILSPLEWQSNEPVQVAIHEIESLKLPVRTKWVEMNLGRFGISRKNDILRYNVFTGEYSFEFNLDLKRNSIRIRKDTKVRVSVHAFSESGTELMQTPPAQIIFAECPICVLTSDMIIYKNDDDGDIHRQWPPSGYGHNERKAKHPSNLKINFLNGHVRENPFDVHQRKMELQNINSPVYHKKLKLHNSIVRNISNAALFTGDWYGSAFMRSLTYTSKDFFVLTHRGGGIWPESLLTMIINVYLRYEESVVYLMATIDEKLEYGAKVVKDLEIVDEYEEDIEKYSGRKQYRPGEGEYERQRRSSSVRSDIGIERGENNLIPTKKDAVTKKDGNVDDSKGCFIS
eukprot:g6001.t1